MIYFVTGKGGVGKSLAASSLAKSLVDRDRKVLLVELGEQSFLQLIYQQSVGFEPITTAHGFDMALWDGASCLKEYFTYLLKIQRMVNLFFDNRITHTLLEGAPGLKELALTGKITSGVRKIGPHLPYDDVVVDCYSTGHFKALIKAPRAMAEAIRIGPMGEQSRSIDRVLKSKDVRYLVVVNPDDLSLTEGEQLSRFLQTEFENTPILIGNKWWPVGLQNSEIDSSLPTLFQEKCRQVAGFQEQSHQVELPQLWDANNLKKIEDLSGAWKEFLK